MHGDFYADRPLLGAEPEHRLVHRHARAIQIFHKGLQAAGVLEHVGLVLPLIDQIDADAGVQERQLPQALGENLVVELDVRENLPAGPEAKRRAALLGVPHRGHGGLRLTQMVFLTVDLAIAADGEQKVVRQGVDHRDADAMQAARDLVRGIVELPARMQHGHDDFGSGSPLFGVDVDRDAAAVVRDGDGLVRMDGDDYAVAIAGQRLVDGVVDDLENHVVQACAVIGISDVHARALSHRVKTL